MFSETLMESTYIGSFENSFLKFCMENVNNNLVMAFFHERLLTQKSRNHRLNSWLGYRSPIEFDSALSKCFWHSLILVLSNGNDVRFLWLYLLAFKYTLFCCENSASIFLRLSSTSVISSVYLLTRCQYFNRKKALNTQK